MGNRCGWFGSRASGQVGHGGGDRLVGTAGRDHLVGRSGDDQLQGHDGNDWLSGGRGNDKLSGDAGRDRLVGGGGNDELDGGTGNDTACGGHGNDVFLYRGGDGNDVFHGGRGTDVIRLESVADGWTLHLQRGQVVSNEGGYCQLSAGASGTLRFADGSVMRFSGVEGIETVGAAEAPVPNQGPSIGGLSANTVDDTAPDGTVIGMVSATDPDAGDTLVYSLVDDAGGLFVIDPATGALMVADGASLDYWTANQHTVEVAVTDQDGLSASATFSIDVQWDNTGDDTVTGTAADDVIDSGLGADRLFGEDGNDHLIGGSGDDELDGGAGDDVLDGGDGDDFLVGGDGDDQLDGGAGVDMMFGDDGDDHLSGGDGADQLFGGMGRDQLDGGDGDDSLFGNSEDDVLNGGAGNDMIFGSLGNDVINGGAGNDNLSGGFGADRFVFDGIGNGVDVISDFGSGDVLAIGAMLSGFSAGQEAAFVRLVDDGPNVRVEVDADGAAGGSSFEAVAVLNGMAGTTLTDLTSAGQIDFWLS